MVRKYIVKMYVVTMSAIFLTVSFLIVLKLIRLNNETVGHPLTYVDLSLLNRICLAGYTIFFLFLLFLTLSLLLPLLLLLLRLGILRYLNRKIFFQKSIVLFGTLPIVHCISYLILELLHSLFLSNLLLVPFYFIVPIIVFVRYRDVRKSKDLKKLIISTVIVFITICISANNTKFVSPITKENIELAVIILIIFALFMILYRNYFYKLQLYYCKLGSYITRATVVLILLSIGISILAFSWDNRKTTFDYKDIASNPQKDMNIILIVIDALRADHLGCYGYERQTSPHIDAFSKEGILFKNCFVQASWTKPSAASYLTSLYPTMHGTISHGSVLPDEVTTLAEVLRKEGFITYSYVANPNLKAIFNFNQGFDFFDDYLMRPKLYNVVANFLEDALPFLEKIRGKKGRKGSGNNIKVANQRVIPWLEKYKDQNFFMYLHYIDPHYPYNPPQPYSRMYSYAKGDENSEDISLYDGEIRFADEHINKLFEKLKLFGIYDKTLIIVTSDHGEAFGEHNNKYHGHTIYQEELRVPLIIKFGDFLPKGKIIEKQVRSIDIMPSILNILDIPCDIHLEGSSFLHLLKSEEKKRFCEYVYVDNNLNEKDVLKGVIKDNEWKYIFTEKSRVRDIRKLGHEELYNLMEDPNELSNLIKEEAEVLRDMRNKLDFYKKHCGKSIMQPREIELDYETIQDLKSLGYLR